MKLDDVRILKHSNILLGALMNGTVHYYALPHPLTNTDMYHAVQWLNSVGIRVSRTDSGGCPTWDIVSVDNKTLIKNGKIILTMLKNKVTL